MQITPAEHSRLGKLAEYHILDSAPEKEFDEIVEVASASSTRRFHCGVRRD